MAETIIKYSLQGLASLVRFGDVCDFRRQRVESGPERFFTLILLVVLLLENSVFSFVGKQISSGTHKQERRKQVLDGGNGWRPAVSALRCPRPAIPRMRTHGTPRVFVNAPGALARLDPQQRATVLVTVS